MLSLLTNRIAIIVFLCKWIKIQLELMQYNNNNSQIISAYAECGDPNVHKLTPMRARHIERPVPTDPQKIFLIQKKFQLELMQ